MPQATAPSPCLIHFQDTCRIATMIKRVKRFSVACELDGETVWAHTNNSGSMLGLVQKGRPVLLSRAANPNRKLPYTLELIGLAPHTASPGTDKSMTWVGVNTMTPNALLKAAFEQNLLPWAQGYTHITMEAKVGKSRIDALMQGKNLPDLWVECKNVSLVEDGVASFPDAVSTRGQKHLGELQERITLGDRGAFFYCIQRNDARCFAPADYIDPGYARLFYEALDAGVEVYPHVLHVSPQGIALGPQLPLAPRACHDV